MIRIALAEDNGFLADSIMSKLALFEEFKVSFHALNGKDLLDRLTQDSNLDVILMDIQMPEMDGIEASKEVTQRFPHIKVIMLTVLDTDQKVYESIQSGAVGYLLKESSPQEIFNGIKQAVSGAAALSPSIALKAMKMIQNPESVHQDTEQFDLTERELQVLRQLSKGLNYKEIASNLIISPNTVRRHIENIYQKLEVSNKAEAIQKAYRNKLC
ncbi:response regulator transcription factor [bacterium SCSIO 12741]|nr:response regulator transcription factor [bacterium SCSIO 12741]